MQARTGGDGHCQRRLSRLPDLHLNPFLRLNPAPLEGRDLNPLLQDPGLIIHPPMLYIGYVGFAVPFAFAVAALLEGRVDARWLRWTRPWTNVAWGFLTLGIALGSWWAYYSWAGVAGGSGTRWKRQLHAMAGRCGTDPFAGRH